MSLTATSTDEEVITACRMHLRGVCGDSLDSMQGPNYQVTSVLEVINHAKNS